MLKLNQEKKGRLNANWKLNKNMGDQEVKTEYFAGIRMPLKNGDPNLDFDLSNSFRARPLKIPRRQYGNSADESIISGSGVSKTLNCMFVMDRPSSSVVTSKVNTLCDNSNDKNPGCCNTTIVPDYRVAVQKPWDCLNKCNTSDDCYNSQKKALTRVRGALLKNPLKEVINPNNGDPVNIIVNYYSDSKSYLRNRVKVSNDKCINTCDTNFGENPKATRVFKPNNSKFNVQGAVSSSTRIADLKRSENSAFNYRQQGVTPSNFCCINNNLNTVGTSHRLAGTSEPPYTEKSKFFIPIIGQRTLFKRSNGNKTICCINND
jgi:hypothetical protein